MIDYYSDDEWYQPIDDEPGHFCIPGVICEGFNDLMHAIMSKDKNKIENIIRDHPNQINETNDSGCTPLMMAATNLRNDGGYIVQMLIDNGAYLDEHNWDGDTALMLCIKNSHFSSIKTIKMLIDAGADIELCNKRGETALMLACKGVYSNELEEITRILIDSGANVNLQNIHDSIGFTALMYAIRNPSPRQEIVQMLINAGANVNLQSNYFGEEGVTALMHAAEQSLIHDVERIVQILLDAGADVNALSSSRRTALMSAIDGGKHTFTWTNRSKRVIKMLLDAGAGVNINQKDKFGNTVLTKAIRGINDKDIEIIQILINEGADVNLKGMNEQTPLHVAAQIPDGKRKEIIKLLIKTGARIDDSIKNKKVFLEIEIENLRIQLQKN